MRTATSRGSRLSSRPFYTTLLLLAILTAYSFLLHTYQPRSLNQPDVVESLVKRSKPPKLPKPECREVHSAEDQCAFVKKYCQDEDAGLLPYIDLYYCKLGSAQPVAFIILVLWLGLLFTTIGIAASDFFSVNLSTIAAILRLSESLAGVTFLAFGNGSPDVFSTFAAMASNSTSMALGELLGAACFISGVVAGSMALVREFKVDRKSYARDICFFIVAVVFTMVFLADGHLHFWECSAMIGYYVLYVTTVVGWHWYFSQRKRRLRREGEARSHYYGMAASHGGDELAGEPYRDDPNDVDRSHGQETPYADISTLENGARGENDGGDGSEAEDDDTDGDHERMVVAEVARSMRVLRTGAKRKSTMTPIRPSLVGALEFRSALAQLQRESNMPLSAMPGRSRSLTHLPRRGRRETTSAVTTPGHVNVRGLSEDGDVTIRRERAASSGQAPISMSVPQELLVQGAEDDGASEASTSRADPRPPSPTPSYTVDGNLAPPPDTHSTGGTNTAAKDGHPSHAPPRGLFLQTSRRSSCSEQSTPNSPFPHYTDSPMLLTPNPNNEQSEFILPSPAIQRRPEPLGAIQEVPTGPKPVNWWPHSILPPPHVLLATLFPTLQGWKEKAIWDKFVSAISVPSIFLLVMTLPVVEHDGSTDEEGVFDDAITAADDPSRRSTGDIPPISVEAADGEAGETEWQRYRRHSMSMSRRNSTTQAPAIHTRQPTGLENEETLVNSSAPSSDPLGQGGKPVSDVPSLSNANDETTQWNRWLVCVQLFTGPLFAVLVLWANMAEEMQHPKKELVKMVLYTLVVSLVLLALLILLTVEHRRPKYHYVLCFLGFVISIAWISTIAGEVVGVLKTFGVVLDISEALLGLTIFAAGNSVGDLVADITVARLGYPVMAL